MTTIDDATAPATVFAALSDPARLAIVRRLSTGPSTVRHIAEPFPISRPAISRHLKVLSDAGVVDHTRSGRDHWYELTPEALTEAQRWLDDIADTWTAALGSLKRLAEEESHGSHQ